MRNEKTIKELKAMRDRLLDEVKIIDGLLVDLEFRTPEHPPVTLYIPPFSYPKNGTWTDKIMFCLGKIQPASPAEVAEWIMEQEPDLDSDTILNTASQYLPSMASKGLLSRTKEGRKFIYTII